MVRPPLLLNQKHTDQDVYNAFCAIMGVPVTIQMPNGVRDLLALDTTLSAEKLMQLGVVFGRSNQEIALAICNHTAATEEVIEKITDLYTAEDFGELVLTLQNLGKLNPDIIRKINSSYNDAGLPDLLV